MSWGEKKFIFLLRLNKIPPSYSEYHLYNDLSDERRVVRLSSISVSRLRDGGKVTLKFAGKSRRRRRRVRDLYESTSSS